MRWIRWWWQPQRTWGHLALGVWLIATGLLPLLGTAVPHSSLILSVLAVAAGILILLRR